VSRRAEETVGQRLKRLRLTAGLSQRELAVPGVSDTYISMIENGSRAPTLRSLERLAPRLGVSPVYLQTGRDPAALEEVRKLVGRALESAGELAGMLPTRRLRERAAELVEGLREAQRLLGRR
jgi:transcriptional regulator with XRE-family HTH domain